MSEQNQSKRVLELCDRALELPDNEREQFLASSCNEDTRLRASVDSVLVAVSQASQFLGSDANVAADSASLIGRQIGHYRIKERLGQGGMGSVYLADRHEEGFDQQVAIKFVHGHMLANELINRFNAERQILAALNHPYIAALIDGGTTDDGIPYLVMEYVDGDPIDEYCDSHKLDIRARIKLIRQVAMAVQSAHQNLIVHRDLKPSNVLITADGIPKLLDFGIAKLLQADSDESSGNTTVFGRQAMTPDYASPEQILENRVTTASDVYTLGILTYQLLAGERPYHVKTSSHREMMESVESLTVPRPSSRLDTLASAGQRARIATQRATTENQLRRSLQGDLDNIILMALRQEPERRYQSVAQFSDDLGKYLKGFPVTAREDSFRYRSGKFLQRNWIASSAAALITLSLAAGLLGYAAQAKETQRQRDIAQEQAARAESTVDFLKDVLFAGDPFATSTNEQTISDVLQYAVEHVPEVYADDPASRASILSALGDIYAARGDYEHSETLSASAVQVYNDELRATGNDAAYAYRAHGLALYYIDEYERADQSLARAIEIYLAAPEPDWAGLVSAYDQIAQVQSRLTDEATAFKYYELALSTYREHDINDPGRLIATLGNMSVEYLQIADYEKADTTLSEAIQLAQQSDVGDATTGQLLSNHAGALKNLDRLDEAVTRYSTAIELLSSSAGPEHPETIIALTSLANLHQQMENLDEAEFVIRQAMDAAGSALGSDRFIISYTQNVAGSIFCKNGNAEEGLAFAQESLQTRRELLPADHWAIFSGAGVVGTCQTVAEAYDAAEESLLPAYAALRELRGDEHEITITTKGRLYDLYIAWGRPEDANEYSPAPN